MFKEELNISNKGFDSEFSNFLSNKEFVNKKIITSVSAIIEDVLSRGDVALIELTKDLE